jgi:hypothetical protein
MSTEEYDPERLIPVNVDFYKVSGKWYTSCNIQVTEKCTIDPSILFSEIVEKQNTLLKTDKFNFIVVVSNVNEDDPFCYRLFHPNTTA